MPMCLLVLILEQRSLGRKTLSIEEFSDQSGYQSGFLETVFVTVLLETPRLVWIEKYLQANEFATSFYQWDTASSAVDCTSLHIYVQRGRQLAGVIASARN